ncbi:type II toxin-antitoxin system Phd/YefM family antitoxin [Actomonas aquatica]|uniref:Type II toxin-antitoxin system Phd/YefM family antitoxin n=1 Tax=Actomonas aquatica TaxID=2866162 RepID=A0ABZ1C2C4_9BACT|nr:type II toxin-antitoxin system Phd/YefM family antitoxin [Opitutus sp. WL0086]WRQ85843.1 type II toxin-antitoxin system Phd/YefM family antitoxin [Opitutus sp. WL0086]
MKTVSIRDLRQKWPAIERGLKGSEGLLVTRDSKPVARLLPLEDPAAAARPRFEAKAHAQWLKKTWGAGAESRAWVDAALAADRGDE